MLLECRAQYASKFGKLSSGHRTGKGQFSFQSQRRAMLKNVQTTTQLHSFQMLAKKCWKFSDYASTVHEPRTSRCPSWILKRQRNQTSNCQHPVDHRKRKKILENHLLLLYWLCQSLWLCGSQKTVENSSRDRNIRTPDLPLEKSVCRLRSNS